MQTDYQTMTWNTGNFAMAAPTEQVSASDLNSLLKGRRFDRKQETDVDMCPPLPECDPEELKELEDYCKKRGIVGVNFSGMSPRLALKMLKGKVEGAMHSANKKELLYG